VLIVFCVALYLINDEDLSAVFLLKVNIPYLKRCVILTSEEQLVGIKDNLHVVLSQCVRCFLKNPSKLRVHHALEVRSCVVL